MIGIKKTEYAVVNNEVGQAWKRRFLMMHDVIQVQEDEKMIIITVGETFDTNEFMFI